LAISCAARDSLHPAAAVETMLRAIVPVIKNTDLRLSEELRKLDDVVDELYSAIQFYLTQISGEALSKEESRRWTDIVSFTINMEQIGDIIERVLQDIEDKKVKKNRSFSEAGMAEIVHLHERLLSNLRLAMSVFLDGHVRDAKRLLEEKAHFRDLEHEYAANHTACLLHDLGHLLNHQGETPTLRGIDDTHQYFALPFLRGLFPDAVLDAIKLHVDAKRYLCRVDTGYYDRLSADSKRSLALQGGVFDAPAAEAFLAQPGARDAVMLRQW